MHFGSAARDLTKTKDLPAGLGPGLAVSSFSPVTDAELARARDDAPFRQQLMTAHLDLLLAKLQRMRKAPRADAGSAKQIREGVQFAVKLAELIQAIADKTKAA